MSASGYPQGAGPHIVDIELELGGIVLAVGAHRDQFRIFHRHAEELIARLHQLVVAQSAAILELEVEAVRLPQLHHRRRREGKGHPVPNLRESPHRPTGHGRRFQIGDCAFLPVLEPDKGQSHVLAATGKAETGTVMRDSTVLVSFSRKCFSTCLITSRVRSWVAPAGNCTWQTMNP